MAAQHTPGPWKTTTACGLTRINIANDQENRVVCSVPVAIPSRDTDAAFGQVDPDAEGEANARLIVAAPELLELAREIADNVILAGMDIGHKARSLIAKATGEQA